MWVVGVYMITLPAMVAEALSKNSGGAVHPHTACHLLKIGCLYMIINMIIYMMRVVKLPRLSWNLQETASITR